MPNYAPYCANQSRSEFIDRANALATSTWLDLPTWARDDPAYVSSKRRYVICGSHMPGEIRFLAMHWTIVGIVDDFRARQQREYMGLPLLDTEEWIELAKRDQELVSINLCGTSSGYNHFLKTCAQHSLRALSRLQAFRLARVDGNPIVGAGSTFVYGLPFYDHTLSNHETLAQIADSFSDEFSKFTFFSILNYRLTGDPNYLDRCSVGANRDRFTYSSYAFNRTFFNFSDQEVFVDGGGFDGDSTESFLRAVGGNFRRIYCFEPAPDLARQCVSRFRRLQASYIPDIIQKIEVIRKGLWSTSTKLAFSPTLFAGHEGEYVDTLPQSAHIIDGGILSHLYSPALEEAASFNIETTTIDETC